MPFFHYTVVNKENKRLSGSIEASDESTARIQLNNLGFSILEISEKSTNETKIQQSTEPNTDLNNKKFVFEAINPQGQKITGTIVSIDDYSAFKRLKQEYELIVTVIYNEEATESQIAEAKTKGTYSLNEKLTQEEALKELEKEDLLTQDRIKKEAEVRTRVEYILKQINELLLEYNKNIPPDKYKEINQRIDKLLRIKNSTNLDYITSTAEELLEFIKNIEVSIKEKNYLEKRTKLKMQVKSLLAKLHETSKPKTLAEDIVNTIQKWQQKNIQKTVKLPWHTRFINKIFTKIKQAFEVPEEINTLKSQIKNYNSQLYEYIKIYLKEPAKEYKQKAREAIASIWAMRKKAINQLKSIQAQAKLQKKVSKEKLIKEREELTDSTDDFTEFTGWLLTFYLSYYFVSLYIITKDFGIGEVDKIPRLLNFYSTSIFKYVLATVFLLHAGFAIKNNFFKKSKTAGLVIYPLVAFLVILVIINF